MNKEDDLFPITKMDSVFEQIESETEVEIGDEERGDIMDSMLDSNRDMIQSSTEHEINVFLLSEIYKTQKMAEMLGPSEVSRNLEDVAVELEKEIEES